MTNEERDSKIGKIYDIVIRLEPMVKDHHATLYANDHGLKKKVTLIEDRQDSCPARQAATMEAKRTNIAAGSLIVAVIAMAIAAIALLTGCTTYHARVGDAEINMVYFLQDKDFETISFNPETHTFTLEGMKSETSQIVSAAITAALKATP